VMIIAHHPEYLVRQPYMRTLSIAAQRVMVA
jgi:hypothetical protein